MGVLFKDGSVVFKDGQVVFTDDPENCECCEPFVHGTVNCGTGNPIIRPRKIVAILSGVGTGPGYATNSYVAAGYPIGTDCGYPSGTPLPGRNFTGATCLLDSPGRIGSVAAMCSLLNGAHLHWDEDECGAAAWNSSCIQGIGWRFCSFQFPFYPPPSAKTGAASYVQFARGGGISFMVYDISTNVDMPSWVRYWNHPSGGFPLVGGVYNTLGTHVLTLSNPGSGTDVCGYPATVTVVNS